MDPVSVDSLLKDRTWLKQLARGLVRDEWLADDVVQEGWLTALKAPPVRHSRAWWRRVLRSRAEDLRRAEMRRRAREKKAARPEGSDDLLEKIELQRRVAEAVASLDEPYRSTVALRYFEELPPRKVALRLGVPVETVRTRLRRAHALLRVQLDGGGEWRTGMLLLAWPGLWSKAAVGGVAVGNTKKVSIVAAALLAVAGLLAVGFSEGEAPVDPRTAHREAVEEKTANAPEEGTEVRDEEAGGAVDASPGWNIEVRTRKGRRESLGGVPVRATVYRGYETEGSPLHDDGFSTDGAGRHAWRLPAFEETVTLVLKAQVPDARSAPRRRLVVRGEKPPRTITLNIRPSDGRIVGVVRDGAGQPIAGATVTAVGEAATSDSSGAFRLKSTSVDQETHVVAWAPGFALKRSVVRLTGGNAEVDFVLRPEFRIEGRVTNEDGHPVEGAVVRSFFTGYMQKATSDRNGHYVLRHLDPGRQQHMILAGHPDYVRFDTVVVTKGEKQTLNLTLKNGVLARGHVRDLDGKPIAGARIRTGHDPVTFGSVGAVSRDDGSFELDRVLGVGEHAFEVQRSGYADTHLRVEIRAGVPLDLRLQRGLVLEGTVSDVAGRPVAGVLFSARHRGEWIGARATSDKEGRWRLEDVPAGTLELWTHHEKYLPVQRFRAESGGPAVELRLKQAGRFAGRVLDDATGKPVAAFTVRFVTTLAMQDGSRYTGGGLGATWVREGHRFTDTNGAWDSRTEQITPGAVVGIEVRADGYTPGSHGKVIAAVNPDPDAFVVRLKRGLTVSGLVVDGVTGAPVPAATVEVDRGGRRSVYGEDTHDKRLVRTDPTGRFSIANLPAVSTKLRVSHPKYAVALDGPFDVGARMLDRRIRLWRGGEIRGRAEPGCEVEIIGPAGTETAKADREGRFRFERLAAGAYRISRRAHFKNADYTFFARPVSFKVELARNAHLDVVLVPRKGATLRVRVPGKGTQGLVVILTPLQGQVGLSNFVRSGVVEFAGVQPGRYRLSVMAGALGAVREIEVEGEEALGVDLELKPLAESGK